MSSLKHSIQNSREEYEKDFLSEENLPENPFDLFEKWINLAFSKGVCEPIAMNVATVSSDNRPSSRIVLLRGFDDNGFTFDHAGHIMFSNDPYVQELYKILLGNNIHWHRDVNRAGTRFLRKS